MLSSGAVFPDLRIENALIDEHGDDVKLKKGAHVEVTVTAERAVFKDEHVLMVSPCYAHDRNNRIPEDETMSVNTLLIIVVVVLLLGGGGFYFGR